MQADQAQLVFASDFHGELDLLQIESIVGENARHVVEGSQPDAAAAEKQRVILGVCVCAGDKPVKADGVDEGVEVCFRGRSNRCARAV